MTAHLDNTAMNVVKYTCNAWGNCAVDASTINTTLANLNPFRYRGYYFDAETGYYYLQTRYYDPTTGRFLNADELRYLGTSDCSVGFNLFSYCDNNPVNRSDVNGHSWISDRFNDVKNAAQKIAKAVSNTAQKVGSTVRNVTKTVKDAVVNTAKKAANTVTNATRKLVSTVSGAAQDAVDWTKSKISDITKGVKSVSAKAKEAVVEAWSWTTKNALPAIGDFFSDTVWKKWIVGGVWETFCKDWVWETFCKDWVWETFCKDWIWETFCKKWVWQTVIQGTWYKFNKWSMNALTQIALGKNNLITIVSIDQSNKNLLLNSKELHNKTWAVNKSYINNQGNYKRYTENISDYVAKHNTSNETIFLKCCNDKDVSDVGCGLIAIYNTALLLGDSIDIRSIIYWFEQNNGFVLNGIFGVNPNVIQAFYDNLNIPATGFSNMVTLENSRTGTTGYYIICQWNDADLITYGAHFYAVRDNGTKLNAYNGPSGKYDNFSTMLSDNNGGGLIYAYRIG